MKFYFLKLDYLTEIYFIFFYKEKDLFIGVNKLIFFLLIIKFILFFYL
jgi:hypothetical protein